MLERKLKLIAISMSIASTCICVLGVYGQIKQQNAGTDKRLEMQLQEDSEMISEEERLKAEEEERLKAEEEERKQKYGVGPNGQDYAYDAKIIWDKLSIYDYSNNGEKIAFLTFDDGPSTTVTPQILDILKEANVKGTFFVLGQQLDTEEGAKILKRIYDEGHAIANHTYTHDYRRLYPGRNLDLNTFVKEIEATEYRVKEILGHNFNMNVVRCPGGYMSWKGMDSLKEHLKENNMASIDWNALNGDAEGRNRSPEELLSRFNESFSHSDIEVILMHDTYGKENTAKMLKQLINKLKEEGYTFKTLI